MKKVFRPVMMVSLLCAGMAFGAVQVYAQGKEAGKGFSAKAEIMTPQSTAADLKAKVNPNRLASLFFTFWEHNAIKDVRNSRDVRPPTEAELRQARQRGLEKPPPGARELVLGGIVYTSENDWTIWLNGKRVTPEALPKEVLDMKVYDEYVEMKWHDEYTSQIFPVRLRAHQRFNMDSRIFLPG